MSALPRNRGCSPSLQQSHPHTPIKLDRGNGGMETEDHKNVLSTTTIPPSPTRPPQPSAGAKRQQDQQRDEQLDYRILDSSVTTNIFRNSSLSFLFKNKSKPMYLRHTAKDYLDFHNKLQFSPGYIMNTLSLDMEMEHHHQSDMGNDNQYGFAIIFHEKGGGVISEKAYPFGQKKKEQKDDQNKKHSEEKLIELIDDYFTNNIIEGGCVLIYTFYSPCLNRCMMKIGEKSFKWFEKYKIMTIVCFTKYWGEAGPKSFDKYKINEENEATDVSKLNDRYNEIPFRLDCKHLKAILQKCHLFKILSGPKYEGKKSDNKKLKEAIKEFLALPEELLQPHVRHEHLSLGKTHVSSIQFPLRYESKLRRKLSEIWKEAVSVCFNEMLTERITTDYNFRVVEYYVRELKSSFKDHCPLQVDRLSKYCAEHLHQLYSRDKDDMGHSCCGMNMMTRFLTLRLWCLQYNPFHLLVQTCWHKVCRERF